jgi:hypothetical protein
MSTYSDGTGSDWSAISRVFSQTITEQTRVASIVLSMNIRSFKYIIQSKDFLHAWINIYTTNYPRHRLLQDSQQI